ncbi:MAG: hypothetical protein ABWX66_05100 [Lacisediminihabitans sp.]
MPIVLWSDDVESGISAIEDVEERLQDAAVGRQRPERIAVRFLDRGGDGSVLHDVSDLVQGADGDSLDYGPTRARRILRHLI